MKSNRGQILPLAFVMILALAFLWIMLVNAGKLISDRVRIQIAADTAVQSACAIRARALNSVGLMNSWLGIPVLAIGIPQMAWWPAPPHPMGAAVAVQSMDDINEGLEAIKKLADSGISSSSIKNALLVGALRTLTSLLGISYDTHRPATPDFAFLQQKFIHAVIDLQTGYLKMYGGAVAYNKARDVARRQGVDDIYVPPRSFALGLVRNHGPIWYWSTLHTYYYTKPLPPLPFPPKNNHIIEDSPTTVRWYERGPNFYRKAMRLYAFRRPDSPMNGPFPLGKKLFSLKMPALYTVASARVYNPDGPMFPSAAQTTGVFGGYEARKEYKRAANGWHSQLVSIGGWYDH